MQAIMRSRPRVAVALLAGVLLLFALGTAVGHADTASPESMRASFSGNVPAAGGLALLVTTESSTPTALVDVLADAGCVANVIAVFQAGYLLFIPGAPERLNQAFPPKLPADTPFFVRCEPTAPAVDPEQATYLIDDKEVTLTDGRSAMPVAPGSASMAVTTLLQQSYGQLDGAGATDAAVILAHNSGGSGTFYYLAVVGTNDPAPALRLGDRLIVQRLSAANGQVVVTYLDRAFDTPFAAPPTMPVTRIFAAERGGLVEIGAGACEARNLDQLGSFVFVTAPAPGAQLFSGFTVEGCSRTFESTVNWSLHDRAGAELVSGHTMGGGFDGPARFSFTVEYDNLAGGPQVGSLRVFEVDVSEGEGYPPPEVVIPIVLP